MEYNGKPQGPQTAQCLFRGFYTHTKSQTSHVSVTTMQLVITSFCGGKRYINLSSLNAKRYFNHVVSQINDLHNSG